MSLHVPLVVLQQVATAQDLQPQGVSNNRERHPWNQHACIATYGEPASCVSLRRFRPESSISHGFRILSSFMVYWPFNWVQSLATRAAMSVRTGGSFSM